MIQKQIRREYVAAVEKKLKQHPLVKFPHYKDHMTPEVSRDEAPEATSRRMNEWSLNEYQSCVRTHLHGVFISIQLFDKVVSVLDPDMCVSSASALPTPAKEDEEDTEPRKEDVGRKKHNKMWVHWQVDWYNQ